MHAFRSAENWACHSAGSVSDLGTGGGQQGRRATGQVMIRQRGTSILWQEWRDCLQMLVALTSSRSDDRAGQGGRKSCPTASPAAPSRLHSLVRVKVEILRRFGQGLLTLDRGDRHFRLECRAVVPARSMSCGLFFVCDILLTLLEKSTYPGCSVFRSKP